MKKMMMAAALAACSAACAGMAHAAPAQKQCEAAGLFVATTNLNTQLAGLRAPDYDNEEHLADFDRDKMPAIKAVASAPDYQAALKDYVVAANDFFRNIASEYGESRLVYQARTASLKSRLEQAQERVKLEEELACGE